MPAIHPGGKSAAAFRTISEVSSELDVPQHVLRFWETKFSQVKPLKRGGGRRYYRPEDIDLLRRIRDLLYDEGYTIKGVQRLLRDGNGRAAERPDTPAEAKAKTRTNGHDKVGGLSVETRGELSVVLADLVAARDRLKKAGR